MAYWLLPVLWAVLIFVLSSLSSPPKPTGWEFPFMDKSAHMIMFGVLAVLLYRAFRRDAGHAAWTAALMAFAFTSIYGGVDELHQFIVPDREMDVWDWVADTCGACVVFLGALRVRAGSP